MTWHDLMMTGIYLVCSYVLFWIGKLIYDLTTPSYRLKDELVEKDNTALAVALTGYYLGLVLAIGGVVAGPSHGLMTDLIDMLIYGPLAIVLLNLSRWINDKLILSGFSTRDELIQDQNVGTGVVVCASYVATGLVINGAISGVLGGVVSAVVFWVLGQAALVLAGVVYDWITVYSVREEIERDNLAAGVGFAGALVGIGIVVRHAAGGDFLSWAMSLEEFGLEVLVGLVLLPVARLATDFILVPGHRISKKIASQEKPSVGVGFLEAFAYIGGAFLIVWAL